MGDYMNLLNLKCESCGASIDVTKDTNVNILDSTILDSDYKKIDIKGSSFCSSKNLCGKVGFLLGPQHFFLHTAIVENYNFSTARCGTKFVSVFSTVIFSTFHSLCG